MNNKIIIRLLILAILLIAVLGLFFFYQTIKTPGETSNVNAQNLPTAVSNTNQNINTDIGIPTVTTPVMQNTPVINTNSIMHDYQPVSINISNFSFNPKQRTVKIGTTVTWINDDPAPHTITSADFTSQTLNTGDSYSFIFTQPGTYDYHCAIHPSMTGQIIVTQ